MIRIPVYNSKEIYEVNPSKIIALGLNYREHIKESVSVNTKDYRDGTPPEPVLFSKTPNVLIADNEDIVIPAFLNDYKFDEIKTEYEAELAFIIKDKCRSVSKENAYDHIFGFTCFNDVSQRNIQMSDKSGWFRGKSFDTFGPIGPVIVKKEDIGDPQDLKIVCRLNGKIVQSANTSDMIFAIPEIVAFVSKNFTLMPGDIISTGTPGGVGRIRHGDIVEVEIEKIGILKNKVTDEMSGP